MPVARKILEAIGLVLIAPLSAPAMAADPPVIGTTQLYAEYKYMPLQADAKYEGKMIVVAGLVEKLDMVDLGVGHIRIAMLAGGPRGVLDGVMLCFTESCASFRRPTVADAAFKTLRVGGTAKARCVSAPVGLSADRTEVDIQLVKCELVP